MDAYSRYAWFYGLKNKSTKEVTTILKQYQADNKPAETFGYINLAKIWADAVSQFTSTGFADQCRQHNIHLALAAPKKQYLNLLAERTWQTTLTMARALLIHVRLPDTFWYHAIIYATHIFNVLPIQGVKDNQDHPATPYELFFHQKPVVARFYVFGCPTVVQKWVTKQSTQGKQTECGVWGIFIRFDANNKGFMIYCPGSRSIITSEDVTFNELFTSAIATMWQQHKDSLALRPPLTTIPLVTDTMKHTSDVDVVPNLAPVKEGRGDDKEEEEDTESDAGSMGTMNDESSDDSLAINVPPPPSPVKEPLHILDNSNNLQRSARTWRPNLRYAHFANTTAWANTCSDHVLVEACSAEAHLVTIPDPQDAHYWEPAPKTI